MLTAFSACIVNQPLWDNADTSIPPTDVKLSVDPEVLNWHFLPTLPMKCELSAGSNFIIRNEDPLVVSNGLSINLLSSILLVGYEDTAPLVISPADPPVLINDLARVGKVFVFKVYPFFPAQEATIPATIGPENDVPAIVW